MVKQSGYSNEQERALDLYLQNHTLTEIGSQVKKTRQTILNWIKKFNWDEQRETLRKESVKKKHESNEEAKQRLIKVYKNIVTKGHNQMVNGDINVSLGDVVRAGEAESKLRGLDVLKIEGKIETQLTAIDMVEVAKEAKEMREKLKNEKNGKK